MIGETFSIRQNGVTISRKVTGEYLQHDRRFYVVQNPETMETAPALADDFDRMFKVNRSSPFIHRKGYKGKNITGAQRKIN